MNELHELSERIYQWSLKNFGKSSDLRGSALIEHLHEEVNELSEAIKAHDPVSTGYQAADVLILLLDLCRRYGMTTKELIDYAGKKMDKNENAIWSGPDELGRYHRFELSDINLSDELGFKSVDEFNKLKAEFNQISEFLQADINQSVKRGTHYGGVNIEKLFPSFYALTEKINNVTKPKSHASDPK
jgi:NTP pyrophosphatase (non-canonical NTP hydrolase)